jgi:hypothetical protein
MGAKQLVTKSLILDLEAAHAGRLIDNMPDLTGVDRFFKKAISATLNGLQRCVFGVAACDNDDLEWGLRFSRGLNNC